MSGRPVIWQLAIGASKNFRLGPDRNCIDLNQQPIDQAPINLDGSELPAYEQSLVKALSVRGTQSGPTKIFGLVRCTSDPKSIGENTP